MIQFCTNDKVRIFRFLNTSGRSSYLTFARGGYIISINPMAIGIFVVPTWNLFQNSTIPGNTNPENTPANIPRKIQRVRYLSRNESLFLTEAIYLLSTFLLRIIPIDSTSLIFSAVSNPE